MFETLEHIDQQLLLTINSWHTDWLDQPMFVISKILIFTPLFLIWLYKTFQFLKLKGFMIFLVAIAVLIVLTDQTSNQTKKSVKRYRPTHNTEIGHLVHKVNDYKGGKYGFFSGHAANTFGIATLLYFTFRRQKTWIKYTFFPFAILATYTRLYLGVHYPSDIIVGIFTGILFGYLVFKIVSVYLQKLFGIQTQ